MPLTARGRQFIPLDDFNTLAFRNASATQDGATRTLAQMGASPLQMVDYAGQTLAETSALTGAGDGFAVMRTNTPLGFANTSSSGEILGLRF